MYSVKVSLISNLVYSQNSLNYLSVKKYVPGDIVKVKIKEKNQLAIVQNINDLSTDKSLIKNLPVLPKKIEDQEPIGKISRILLKELQKISISTGVSFGFLLAKFNFSILKKTSKLNKISFINLQTLFSKKFHTNLQSVTFICPLKSQTKGFENLFKQILPDTSIDVFDFQTFKKEIFDGRIPEKKSIFFLATSNPNYYSKNSPNYNEFKLVETILNNCNKNVFNLNIVNFKKNQIKTDALKLLVNRLEFYGQDDSKNILSDRIINEIKKYLQNDENIYVLNEHPEIATSVICNDCQNYAVDELGNNYSVIKDKNEIYWYKSETKTILAKHTCQFCNGTNLKLLGITKSKTKEIFNQSLEPKLTNKMIFVSKNTIWRYRPDSTLLIPSLNHLRSFFNYRQDELLLTELVILSLFYKKIIIQTRPQDESFLKIFSEPDKYWNRSFILRNKFNLPPYGKLITMYFPLKWLNNENQKIVSKWAKNYRILAKTEIVKRHGIKIYQFQGTVKNLPESAIEEIWAWPIGYYYKIE